MARLSTSELIGMLNRHWKALFSAAGAVGTGAILSLAVFADFTSVFPKSVANSEATSSNTDAHAVKPPHSDDAVTQNRVSIPPAPEPRAEAALEPRTATPEGQKQVGSSETVEVAVDQSEGAGQEQTAPPAVNVAPQRNALRFRDCQPPTRSQVDKLLSLIDQNKIDDEGVIALSNAIACQATVRSIDQSREWIRNLLNSPAPSGRDPRTIVVSSLSALAKSPEQKVRNALVKAVQANFAAASMERLAEAEARWRGKTDVEIARRDWNEAAPSTMALMGAVGRLKPGPVSTATAGSQG